MGIHGVGAQGDQMMGAQVRKAVRGAETETAGFMGLAEQKASHDHGRATIRT